MPSIASAASQRPDGTNPTDINVVLLVKPGTAQHFDFFHPACFEHEHKGKPRMLFTQFQAIDAIRAHDISSFCAACGLSVILAAPPRAGH